MLIVLILLIVLCIFLLRSLADSEYRRIDAEREVDFMLDEILHLRVQIASSVSHVEYEKWRNRAMGLMELFAPNHYAICQRRDAELAKVNHVSG